MEIWVDVSKDENGNPNGNDDGPGTCVEPLATIEEATKRVQKQLPEKELSYD